MNWKREFPTSSIVREEAVTSFATRVYSWLALGLLTTAAVTGLIYNYGLERQLAPFYLVWGFALMGIAFTMQRRAHAMSFNAMAALFMAYAVVEGLFFGTIIPIFAAQAGIETVWLAFASAGVACGTAITYGAFTRSDLTALGSLLNIGLLGLCAVTLLCLVLSFFMPINGLQLIVAYAGLLLFVGLAATDAQKIKTVSHRLQMEGGESASNLSLLVALRMYANVIMVFFYLLQILSASRDDR